MLPFHAADAGATPMPPADAYADTFATLLILRHAMI